MGIHITKGMNVWFCCDDCGEVIELGQRFTSCPGQCCIMHDDEEFCDGAKKADESEEQPSLFPERPEDEPKEPEPRPAAERRLPPLTLVPAENG